MRHYIHLRAPHDRNGNPRRLYLLYDHVELDEPLELVEVIDEGYGGLPDTFRGPDVVHLATFDIPAHEYHGLLHLHGKSS